MKRILPALLACALSSLCIGANANEKVVLYGDDDYAPYSYAEGGQLKGIYVDILKAASERLAPAYAVELKPMPWKRGLADLESGTSMALFPPYMRKEQRPFIAPYSTVIYTEEVVLFCRDDYVGTTRKSFPADFSGAKIAINHGFSLADMLSAAVKSGTVTVTEATGNERNLRLLASKRADCYANDRASVLYSLKKLKRDPAFTDLKLVESVKLSQENAYIGYSAPNQAAYKADFIQKMNAALEAVKKEGTVQKAVDTHLK